jgi:threonine 3-dehydrogenase
VPLADVMTRLGMTEGFDVGFEMSGKPAALRTMLAGMCHGGRIAMLGLPSEDFGIDWAHLVSNMITIKGIYGRQMFETWYWMSVFVHAGLDVSPVVTHRFAADDYRDAFAVVASGECGKVVLSWSES